MKKRRVLFTNIAINDLADIEEYIESAFSEFDLQMGVKTICIFLCDKRTGK